LKKQLQEIGWKGDKNSPRVLIFTEYRKTQEVLANAVAAEVAKADAVVSILPFRESPDFPFRLKNAF